MMWYLILPIYSLVLGTSALTYNGQNSLTLIPANTFSNVNNANLTLTLRTRQVSAFVLSSSVFNVSIANGKLTFTTQTATLIDSQVINDGAQHTILLESGASTTTLYVDNVKRKEENNVLLDDTWKTSIPGTSIELGKGLNSIPYYQGCFNGLSIGENNIDLENLTTQNTQSGCQSSIDSCTPDPCVNSTCSDDFNDFKCSCPTFYTSKTCNETNNINCAFKINLCENGGTCVNLTTGQGPTLSENGKDFFRCDCAAGFAGNVCATNINECDPDPCQNGNCTDQINGYKCVCNKGYQGDRCQTDINECDPNPCQNNRPCSQPAPGEYACDCGGVYTGKNCSTDVNECALDATLCNNGNCTNLPGAFDCTCEQGYFGSKCEYNNTQLCEVQKPCKNGGTCRDDINGFNCTCAENYEGVNCQSAIASDDDDNLPLILGLSLGAFAIILIILITCLVRYCRDKSGMEGTYSPNKEEQIGGNVEMHAVKKPKTERLI